MLGKSFSSGVHSSLPCRALICFIISSCAVAFCQGAENEFFVSPTGSPQGDGSYFDPWDLQTAFDQPTGVLSSDVIWLRGGIYRSNDQPTKFVSVLEGSEGEPITVLPFPGERATIDGFILQTGGGWVDYEGFEIMNSHTNRLTTESGPFPTNFSIHTDNRTTDLAASGFDLRAPNVKLINLVIHDSIGGGIAVNTNATGTEIYGGIIFYNGWQGCDRGHGHGLYIQSQDPGNAIVRDSVFVANHGFGIQATANSGSVDNLLFEGNAVFLNGIVARKHQGNLMLGPVEGLARNPALIHNFIYDPFGNSSDVNIGYSGGSSNALIVENYFQTSVHFSTHNEGLILADNIFVSGTLFLEQTNYEDNLFLEGPPETNVVEIRPNAYEPGRAHIIIYNWENAPSVTVDLSSYLPPGTPFEIRNAQNYFGQPVVSGTFEGEPIQLPMTDLLISKPVGPNAPLSTAPPFNVFILQLQTQSPDPAYINTPPNVSSISNQVTEKNLPLEAVPLSVQDSESPAAYLTISVQSSNPELIPLKNITISGQDFDRTLSILPSPDQVGSSVITISVCDGFLASQTSFNIDVVPAENPRPQRASSHANLIARLEAGNATIRVEGVPNIDYNFQASSDLTNWQFIGSVATDCQGIGTFTDSNYTNQATRYYLVVEEPAE